MVSFWPFKGDDTSAASFEKVLSTLSGKINKASAKNDLLRQRQRRYRVLWTLYTGFAYLLAALILTLVTGWSQWNAAEYTGLAGAPIIIFGVRLAIEAYYNYRIAGTQTYLNDLTKQREHAIEKLKAATKYNSTQQLLDKYSGSSSNPQSVTTANRKKSSPQSKPFPPQIGRTGIPPPPTANIPSRQPQSTPASPQAQHFLQNQISSPARTSTTPTHDGASPTAEFAPNAFSAVTTPITNAAPEYAPEHSRWYDRILDVVLGEDETQPKNRIVLICQHCRLVNGQAPPGTRNLDDMGRWRCSGCGTMNGKESETSQMIRKVARSNDERATSDAKDTQSYQTTETKDKEMQEVKDDDRSPDLGSSSSSSDEVVVETPPAGSTRSTARQRKN